MSLSEQFHAGMEVDTNIVMCKHESAWQGSCSYMSAVAMLSYLYISRKKRASMAWRETACTDAGQTADTHIGAHAVVISRKRV